MQTKFLPRQKCSRTRRFECKGQTPRAKSARARTFPLYKFVKIFWQRRPRLERLETKNRIVHGLHNWMRSQQGSNPSIVHAQQHTLWPCTWRGAAQLVFVRVRFMHSWSMGRFLSWPVHNYQNIVSPMSSQTEWPHAVGLLITRLMGTQLNLCATQK